MAHLWCARRPKDRPTNSPPEGRATLQRGVTFRSRVHGTGFSLRSSGRRNVQTPGLPEGGETVAGGAAPPQAWAEPPAAPQPPWSPGGAARARARGRHRMGSACLIAPPGLSWCGRFPVVPPPPFGGAAPPACYGLASLREAGMFATRRDDATSVLTSSKRECGRLGDGISAPPGRVRYGPRELPNSRRWATPIVHSAPNHEPEGLAQTRLARLRFGSVRCPSANTRRRTTAPIVRALQARGPPVRTHRWALPIATLWEPFRLQPQPKFGNDSTTIPVDWRPEVFRLPSRSCNDS